MLLFLNIIKKIYSPCLVSVVHLAYFVVSGGFSGVCHSFLQTKLFRKTWTPRLFYLRNFNPPLDFSLQCKEGQSIGPIFQSAWKNLQTFRSNSNDCCFATGAFNFPMELVTIRQTTAQLEINISDRSCMTNATYQTGTP